MNGIFNEEESLKRLRAHPSVIDAEMRIAPWKAHQLCEVIVTWRDQRLNEKTFFCWDTSDLAFKSAFNAVNNRDEILSRLF